MYKLYKRLFDIIFSFFSILIFSPIFLIISIAIILIDKETPIFFHQRVGLNKKLFLLYKFRTMSSRLNFHSKETLGTNDPRITRIGRTLRRFKIDELPQLMNILKGEMSFVGPRPEIPYYVKNFTPHENKIFSVKPGLTDFATLQLINLENRFDSKKRITAEEFYSQKIQPQKKKLQLQYIEEISFINDFLLILKTIIYIFKGRK